MKHELLCRTHILGCCGEKEYLKLYAYALSEFPIVVHLNLHSLVLRPMEDLFHAMLGGAGGGGVFAGGGHAQRPSPGGDNQRLLHAGL